MSKEKFDLDKRKFALDKAKELTGSKNDKEFWTTVSKVYDWLNKSSMIEEDDRSKPTLFFIFYIYVGGMDDEDVEPYVNEMSDRFNMREDDNIEYYIKSFFIPLRHDPGKYIEVLDLTSGLPDNKVDELRKAYNEKFEDSLKSVDKEY